MSGRVDPQTVLAAAVAVLAAGAAVAWFSFDDSPSPRRGTPATVSSPGTPSDAAGGYADGGWRHDAGEALAQARSEGRPALLFYTAEW